MSSAFEKYKMCTLCPRACGVDRTEGALGRCRSGEIPRIAHVMLHHWEEPCISGTRGSGTVFFSGCPLGCVYCQNHQISRGYIGAEHNADSLSELFLSLEKKGAHNVNLVTATHYIPHVAEAISKAREAGLSIPVVYNTSGYETEEALSLLEGLVDIYLTDVRYHNTQTASLYSAAPDYPHVATAALSAMQKQVGAPVLDGEGLMKKGVIVRLLLLPGHLIEAKQILKDVYRAHGDGVYISLMSQYTPSPTVAEKYPALSRTVTPYEYASLVEYARSLGVTRAFTQEGSSASESFIPPFLAEN
ncbi:MAG: radical SAM protein [Ruminococcaceae bacterium]|nr:radical SAM protein [Oscillospiraceae bacterium]